MLCWRKGLLDFDVAAKDEGGDGAEVARVAAAIDMQTLGVAEGGAGIAQQVALFEDALSMARNGHAAVNDRDVGAGDTLNGRAQQGEMGAAKHQGIHTLS